MTLADLEKSLYEAGLRKGDTIMIHGDSMVIAQLKKFKGLDKYKIFFKCIQDYLGKYGTIVVPTFSYSFTKGEIYDVQNSKSRVGSFSEYFRIIYPECRSSQPIFSVASAGYYKNDFKNIGISDCFGEDSCFGLLDKLNGKILNLGCGFLFTFVHYVEQKEKVKYRYFKTFHGKIKTSDKVFDSNTKYYVGDLNLKYHLNLDRFRDHLIKSDKIKYNSFGRLGCYTVNCNDIKTEIMEKLKEDPYYLIEEGIH